MDVSTTGDAELRRLIADLRGFEKRKEVVKALRKELRRPVPKARQAIRGAALRMLPRRGGLNAWVAASRVTAQVRLGSARSAGITLRGGRNSQGGRSDIKAIDRGRVRAPAWGNRSAWHSQTVPEGYFTKTVSEDLAPAWREAAVSAVNEATEVLRRG